MLVQGGAVGELMVVIDVQQQDGDLFPVLAGNEDNEAAEKNSQNETHGGPLFSCRVEIRTVRSYDRSPETEPTLMPA